jgi:adenylate cyclase class IV
MKEVEIKYRIKDRSSFYRLREYFLNHYADRIFLTENEEVRDHYYRSDDDISMRIRHLQRQDLYLRTIKGRSHIDERGFKVR